MISVIIPCYNYGKYLAECIESVLAQTYKGFEIILVDDFSTDNTRDICREYSNKYSNITFIYPNRNVGLSAARNKGIEISKGDKIFCLDADDMLMDNCLEKCLSVKADIVCPGLQEFGERRNFQFAGTDLTLEGFKKSNQIHASSLYNKEMWVKLGGYDETMREGYEDWDFWLRALVAGYTIETIDEPLFLYRIHSDSMVHSTHKKHAEIKQYMLNKINN